jgi:acyl-CoA reductase-like NAD-dependent aldehyde dehydrogenase
MMIDEDEAVVIANDATHGLAGYVQGGDMDRVCNGGNPRRADLPQRRAT